ncbi:MAG: hypothetical protein A2X46_10475 [Lentisphaerae bacterium GWF2_57_35]|nr:MAG: hypothetical protein A2X46_10475 [Lentisphaerae bacterium GWF2_57_35]
MTDFGRADSYVAEVKGVILSSAPEAQIVDACHEIPFADSMAGAWVLSQYWSFYPAGTIHVAGVGNSRRNLLAEVDGHVFLAPDNGVLAFVLRDAKTSRVSALRGEVHRPGPVSSTFHGRDVLAWAAALLAKGDVKVSELSDPVERWISLELPLPQATSDGVVGSVVHVDRFGNLITNITRNMLEEGCPSLLHISMENTGRDATPLASEEAASGVAALPTTKSPSPMLRQCQDAPLAELGCTSYLIRAGSCEIVGLCTTYAEVPPGQPVALIGSSDRLEISMAGESAAVCLEIKRGDPVRIRKMGIPNTKYK